MDPTEPAVLWIGRFFNHDGYGSCSRAHLATLRASGLRFAAVDASRLDVVAADAANGDNGNGAGA